MSSPMYDIPEHFYMGFNDQGEGPAADDEVVLWSCWCYEGLDCDILRPRDTDPGYGNYGVQE